MWLYKKPADGLRKVVNPASQWSSWAAVVALGLITLVVAFDVILRTAFNMPVPASIEIVSIALLIVFFAPLADSELRNEHIRVDVLVGKLTLSIRQIITTNGYFLSLGIVVLIAWQFFAQAEILRYGHNVTGFLRLPLWPFVMAIFFLMTVFAFALLISFFNHFSELLNAKGLKGYLWLLPGIVVALALFTLPTWSSWLTLEVASTTWGVIIFLLLFVLIFLKVHIGAVLALTAFFGLSYLSGSSGAAVNLSMTAITQGTEYTWSVIPLFLWMGLLVFYAGYAKDLYRVAHAWIGHVPGGLASATVGACTAMAAVTGDSMPGVLTMGVIALPEMRAYKYDMKLSTACICTASTIGILIPPSLGFIIYGIITKVSIGKLFIAGIFPGLLMGGVLIAMVTIMCIINPKLGPRGPVSSWKERLVSLAETWQVMILGILVLGGLYLGIFTPNEAGAIGCFGAIVIGVAMKRLSWKGLTASVLEAVRLNGIMMFIFLFAFTFSRFLATTKLPYEMSSAIIALDLSPYAVIALILFIYMILGCLMNSTPAVILTLPIFYPIAMSAGFDPVWFGVLIVVMVQLGQITPPIGMNVFAMAAIAKDVPMYDIFRGVLPFWAAIIFIVIILVIFPQISLFLPSLM